MARTQTSKIKNFPFRKSGYRVKVPEQAIQTLLYLGQSKRHSVFTPAFFKEVGRWVPSDSH
ncbi:serine/threonine-protein kinase A-Raf-like protein [Corchorus olitorius]|uniref:Serine/threonine-protein kinase A-Raf-like protein n=1 Tax=Corchorus olitorius TaxID=93759 RepID=A0A1R3L0J4_9ROSI|nr:serine/threonine-protein kinase A-Raf-like protein [Corchorus olitorius]